MKRIRECFALLSRFVSLLLTTLVCVHATNSLETPRELCLKKAIDNHKYNKRQSNKWIKQYIKDECQYLAKQRITIFSDILAAEKDLTRRYITEYKNFEIRRDKNQSNFNRAYIAKLCDYNNKRIEKAISGENQFFTQDLIDILYGGHDRFIELHGEENPNEFLCSSDIVK